MSAWLRPFVSRVVISCTLAIDTGSLRVETWETSAARFRILVEPAKRIPR